MTAIIEVEGLTKSYGSKRGITNVSFQCGRGRGVWFPRPQWRGQNHHHSHADGATAAPMPVQRVSRDWTAGGNRWRSSG